MSPVQVSLHWLQVNSRIEFKVIFLTTKLLNGLAPLYLKELKVPYHLVRPLTSKMQVYW